MTGPLRHDRRVAFSRAVAWVGACDLWEVALVVPPLLAGRVSLVVCTAACARHARTASRWLAPVLGVPRAFSLFLHVACAGWGCLRLPAFWLGLPGARAGLSRVGCWRPLVVAGGGGGGGVGRGAAPAAGAQALGAAPPWIQQLLGGANAAQGAAPFNIAPQPQPAANLAQRERNLVIQLEARLRAAERCLFKTVILSAACGCVVAGLQAGVHYSTQAAANPGGHNLGGPEG